MPLLYTLLMYLFYHNYIKKCNLLSVDLLDELYYAINEILGGKMDIKKIFAFNVKKYRKLLKLSQEELALRANLHRTYISDVEREVRSISLDNIQKLANALNVDIYLLFLEEEK